MYGIYSKHIPSKIYTVRGKKGPPFYFSNNCVNNQPILMIFGVLNPEKI